MGVTAGNGRAAEASMGVAVVSAGAMGVAGGVAATAGMQALTARASSKTNSSVFIVILLLIDEKLTRHVSRVD
jgi:hypothetical protein